MVSGLATKVETRGHRGFGNESKIVALFKKIEFLEFPKFRAFSRFGVMILRAYDLWLGAKWNGPMFAHLLERFYLNMLPKSCAIVILFVMG
jgi:hypothetical protein